MAKDASDAPTRRPWSRAGVLGAVALLLTASTINYYLYYSYMSASSAADSRHASAFASTPHQTERDVDLVDSLIAALEEKRLIRSKMELETPLRPKAVAAAATTLPAPRPFQDDEDAALSVQDDIHIVFSMSCEQGRRVMLQTILQYSAEAVGQRGPITQILSGCTPEQQERILREEPALYHDFRRHFTPAYSPHPVPNVTDNYTPYNKPFALRHFLHHAEPPVTQRAIALLDGDTVFFKKLTVNTGADMRRYFRPIGDDWNDTQAVDDSVEDGVAIAQDWLNYLGTGWLAKNKADKLAALCAGDAECVRALLDTPEAVAREHFAGPGPPYVMTRNDAVRMVDDYCGFLVKMRESDRGWMTEMYAYTVAAARHGIKHKLFTHLGITHPSMDSNGREDWTFLSDGSARAEAEAAEPVAMQNPCEDDAAVVLPQDAPVSVHYCQMYGFVDGRGNESDHHAFGHFFYKYSLPEGIMQCDSELLKVPPATDWSELPFRNWTAKFADKSDREMAVARRKKYHELWFACSMTKVVNQAVVRYKRRTCPLGFNAFHGVEIERKEDEA